MQFSQLQLHSCYALVTRNLYNFYLFLPMLKISSSNYLQKGYKKKTTSNGINSVEPKNLPKRLAAFDFDYTVVSQDTDFVVIDLLPADKITPQIKDIIGKEGWMPYMAAIFRLLHECNCSVDRIRDSIRAIPEVPGFIKCLKSLRHQNCDLIIISDSNSVFINDWLQTHGLTGSFEAIFTNPAEFLPNGLLNIKPYHHQTDCRLSATNLCKGKILEEFIVERSSRHGVKYDQLIYAGDGSNDICPVVRLKQGDLACARTGFSMAKNFLKHGTKLNLQAEILLWRNGFDLLAQIENAWIKEKDKKATQ